MFESINQKYQSNRFHVKDCAIILKRVYDAYFDKDLQQTACALTHRTLLAIVPFLAMVFAIAKGFDLQNFLLEQLAEHFPSQKEALNYAVTFVDSYLKHATDGVFIGVGVVALVVTLYFLINAVEVAFDKIWDCKERSYSRKFSDYTSIMFWVPVMMIVAFGISVWIDTGIRSFFDLPSISNLVKYVLLALNFLLEWGVFILVMKYMPNTRVKLRYAAISGLICSVAFDLLQELFELTLYVSSYHAVYGSFAYLPLFLLWVQFSWLICLLGAQIASAAQCHFADKKKESAEENDTVEASDEVE